MQWTMEKIMDLSTGYWQAGALITAVELDLFSVLGDEGATASQVARKLKVSERHVSALLTALTGLHLLQVKEGRFTVDAGAAPFLSPAGEMCLLDSLRFNADLYKLWGQLTETVRSGKPAIPSGAHLGMDEERTRRFVMGMHSRALGLAPALLPAMPVPEAGSLLDAAAGPGTLSRILAEERPTLEVTQMDLPPVLEVAKDLTKNSPAAGRIRFLPGDYRKDEITASFDAALFCGALHQESVEEGQGVLNRIYRAIRPGGQLIIADLMLDEDHAEPVFAALFGLTMMLTSLMGGVHSTRTVEQMMDNTGLTDITLTIPGALPYRVLTGRKPEQI